MKRKIKRRQIKPFYKNDYGKLYHSNCISILKQLENKIDLVITSPPYDDLRVYEGYKFEFEKIATLLSKCIKNGGVIVWVVSDSTKNYNESGTSFKQALYFKELGLNLYDTMIYNKISSRPSTIGKYQQMFEYMFIFSKGKVKTFNPIKIKALGGNKRKNWSRTELLSKINRGKNPIECNYISAKPKYKIKGNIWTYPVGKYNTTKENINHPAIFPENLARDHILSWSNEGDVVLDPLAGSGTVAKVAQILNRKWIAIEISKKYCKNIKKRMQVYTRKQSLF